MGFKKYIASQFANPRGLIGKICCLFMNNINKKMYKKVVQLMDLNEDSTMLDIGFGNGLLIKKAYKKTKLNIYGIDISNDMVKLAYKKNKKIKKANKLTLSVGDCCALDFSNNSFDLVTSINTIYFWSDTVKGLKEINRVLKDGASFYNVVYTKEWLDKLSYTNYGFKKFLENDYINLGKEAGFSNIVIKEIGKDKSIIVIYTK